MRHGDAGDDEHATNELGEGYLLAHVGSESHTCSYLKGNVPTGGRRSTTLARMTTASTSWMLPGHIVPYILVWKNDSAANDTARIVPAATAILQLNNWAVSYSDTLLDLDEALRAGTSAASAPKPTTVTAQVKSRISAAVSVGRLVVLNSTEGVTANPSVKRKVTFKFVFTSSSALTQPYVVAVNGVVQTLSPLTVNHGGTFSVEVAPDSTVSLYLNSDASTGRRKSPVYGITPRERDVHVTITEKMGKHNDPAVPVFKKTEGPANKKVDYYTAPLTGDIWMQVSYKFTEEDAKSLLPTTTHAAIRTAVLSIYRNELTQNSLSVTLPVEGTVAPGAPSTQKITMNFSDSDNPIQNINSFSLRSDGLTRVHPKAFLVLFEAARTAGISTLAISSNWRPLLGSIAHRSGLGVDVNSIEDATQQIRLNRKELRTGTPDLPWVSTTEKQLFGQYEAAKKTVKDAAAALKSAEVELTTANKALAAAKAAKAKAKNDPAKLQAATAAETTATQAQTAATNKKQAALAAVNSANTARGAAKTTWNTELDTNEPATMRSFRNALSSHAMVRQVFDPWYMDINTRDTVAATANEQCTSNETLHAHHLHVTIYDPVNTA
ncbi:hypothetical protein [Melittangium boletus]|uniref:hypothetical protein n=1 Tax=Melittangium boletus TaxID=83453 RepID=UPI003DA42743